ncbi:MAG: hypothetical protein LBV75_03395 [Paludibacter sp.]|jgi:hypothetical protein|nr:hypothetical protein [Paludibacter sp.]
MLAKEYQKLFIAGAILTVVGAFLAIPNLPFAPYAFSLGAFCVVISHVLTFVRHRSDSVIERRQQSIVFIVSIVLAIAAYLMFNGNNLWVVCLMIYAVTILYLSFRQK